MIGAQKNPDQKSNQGSNALEGSKSFEPSSNVCGKALHRGLVYPGHTIPSELKHAGETARFVTGGKRKQIFVSVFHRGAHYTPRKILVKKYLLLDLFLFFL
jgi:hypothetical protein